VFECKEFGALADEEAVLRQPLHDETSDRDRVREALHRPHRPERSRGADHHRGIELDLSARIRQTAGPDVVVLEIVLAHAHRRLDGVDRPTTGAQNLDARR
jgi:hypothetical protein